jgi:hypothetical protein
MVSSEVLLYRGPGPGCAVREMISSCSTFDRSQK